MVKAFHLHNLGKGLLNPTPNLLPTFGKFPPPYLTLYKKAC